MKKELFMNRFPWSIHLIRLYIRTSFTIVALIFAAPGCKEKPVETFTGIVTFKAGTVLKNGNPVDVGEAVKKNDMIRTKKMSAAVIQFSSSSLVAIQAGTEVKISKLIQGVNGKAHIELTQNSGKTFNKIIKGRAKYFVKTPTAVASVRGTSFQVVVVNDAHSGIELLRGKVEVSVPVKEGSSVKPVVLTEGNKAETTEKGELKSARLTGKETERLKEIDRIGFTYRGKPEDAVPGKEIIVPKNAEKIITSKGRKNRYTLAGLRKKYGSLSMIRTKKGAVYIGSFKQLGNRVEVVTVKGKITLPSSTIFKVSPYNYK
jgi:hypothetical protein